MPPYSLLSDVRKECWTAKQDDLSQPPNTRSQTEAHLGRCQLSLYRVYYLEVILGFPNQED
jgi:hypothetical protein